MILPNITIYGELLMKDYASLRKKNNGTLMAVIALAVCVVLSATLLFGRLLSYSPEQRTQRIPLTESNGITHVTPAPRTAAPLPAMPRLLAAPPMVLASPGFEASDENTVWSGETNVEIFRISYDNETGETTVRSLDGDKVLAPGVGSSYSFELENTGNVSLDYTMEMDAWFSDTEYPIPVFVRVCDANDRWLLGSEGEMVEVLRLAEVKESGTLAAGFVRGYTLEWEWPFELDDVYDTMLGNLAVEEDITLTIQIRTTATYSDDPQAPGGDNPATGDTGRVGMYAILMVVSLGGILFILLPHGKEEENEAR